MILDNEKRNYCITAISTDSPHRENQSKILAFKVRGVSPGVNPRPSLNAVGGGMVVGIGVGVAGGEPPALIEQGY